MNYHLRELPRDFAPRPIQPQHPLRSLREPAELPLRHADGFRRSILAKIDWWALGTICFGAVMLAIAAYAAYWAIRGTIFILRWISAC